MEADLELCHRDLDQDNGRVLANDRVWQIDQPEVSDLMSDKGLAQDLVSDQAWEPVPDEDQAKLRILLTVARWETVCVTDIAIATEIGSIEIGGGIA